MDLGSKAQWLQEARDDREAARQALAAADLMPLGRTLMLWADGDEEDLEANLYGNLGMPPLDGLDLDALPGQGG
jgi:hypothetical protein